MVDDEHPRTSEEEAELLARLEDQVRRMSVGEHLVYMVESLAGLCTRKLGLTEGTREERDLDQARLAIDAFKALLQVAEPVRPQQEVAAHRSLLAQLQLAYVNTLSGVGPGEPDEETREATQPDPRDARPAEAAPDEQEVSDGPAED